MLTFADWVPWLVLFQCRIIELHVELCAVRTVARLVAADYVASCCFHPSCQVEQLVRDYKQHQASPLSTKEQGLVAAADSFQPSKPPPAAGGQQQQQGQQQQGQQGSSEGKGPGVDPPWVMTPEDDDIYN